MDLFIKKKIPFPINIFLVSFKETSSEIFNFLNDNKQNIKIFQNPIKVKQLSIKAFKNSFKQEKNRYVFTLDDYEDILSLDSFKEALEEIKYTVLERKEVNFKDEDDDKKYPIGKITSKSKEHNILTYFEADYNPEVCFHYINDITEEKRDDKNENKELGKYLQFTETGKFLRNKLKEDEIFFWGRREKKEEKNKENINFLKDLKASLISNILCKVYKIESEKKKNREFYGSMLMSMDYGAVLLDLNSYVIWANKARKTFQKNNVCGKICKEAFGCICGKDIICLKNGECFQKIQRINNLKIQSFKKEPYFISVVNSPYNLNKDKNLPIKKRFFVTSIIRDIKTKVIIDNARLKINKLNNYKAIREKLIKTFINLGFKRVFYFETLLDKTIKERTEDNWNLLIGKDSHIEKEAKGVNHLNQNDFRKTKINYNEDLKNLNIVEKPKKHTPETIKKSYKGKLPDIIKKLGLSKHSFLTLPVIYQKELICIIIVDSIDNLSWLDDEKQKLIYNFATDYLSIAIGNSKKRNIHKETENLTNLINFQKSQTNDIIRDILKHISTQTFNCFGSLLYQTNILEKKIIRQEAYINSKFYPDAKKTFGFNEGITGLFVRYVLKKLEKNKEPIILNIIELKKDKEIKIYQNGGISYKAIPDFEFIDELTKVISDENINIKENPPEIKNILLVALIFDGELIGVLTLLNNEKKGELPFSWQKKEILKSFSQYISPIVKKTWTLEINENDILKISQNLNIEEKALKSFCIEITNSIKAITNSDCVEIMLKKGHNYLERIAISKTKDIAFDNDEKLKTVSINDATNLKSLILSKEYKKKEIFCKNRKEIEKYEKRGKNFFKKAKSLIILPLFKKNIPIGVISIFSKKENIYSEDFRRFFNIKKNLVEIAISYAIELKEDKDQQEILYHELSNLFVPLRNFADLMNYIYPKKQKEWDSIKDKIFDSMNLQILKKYYPNFREESLFLETGRPLLSQIKRLNIIGELLGFHISNYLYVKKKERKENFKPKDIIIKTLKMLEIDMTKDDINWVSNFDFDFERLIIFSYKYKFSLIMYNLISNAVKYSFQHKEIEVKGCISIKNNTFTVTISNYGNGIKEEEKDKIFEDNYRGKNIIDKTIGLGKGLYIVKKVLNENFNGNIELKNFDSPTIFKIIIPITKED